MDKIQTMPNTSHMLWSSLISEHFMNTDQLRAKFKKMVLWCNVHTHGHTERVCSSILKANSHRTDKRQQTSWLLDLDSYEK